MQPSPICWRDFLFAQVTQIQAIMTDGGRRGAAHPLGNEDIRVPADAGGGGSGNMAMGSIGELSGGYSVREMGAVEISPDPSSEQLPYPALAPAVFFCFKQTTRPRSWCLKVVCNSYPFPMYLPTQANFEELIPGLFHDVISPPPC